MRARATLPWLAVACLLIVVLHLVQQNQLDRRSAYETLVGWRQQLVDSAAFRSFNPAPVEAEAPPAHVIMTSLNGNDDSCVADNEHPWQTLDNYNIQVYSAYVDTRAGSSLIRFVVYKNFGVGHRGQCVLRWTSDEGKVLQENILPGKFDSINSASPFCDGGCAWRYEAFYFYCPLTNSPLFGNNTAVPASATLSVALRVGNETTKPIQPCPTAKLHGAKIAEPAKPADVSIAETVAKYTSGGGSESSWLLAKAAPRLHNLSLCLPALFNFGDWPRLVVWLEWHRLLGATQVVLYNHSYADNVDQVLRYYTHIDVLRVLPWPRLSHPDPMPNYIKRWESISNLGQIGSANDCILRVASTSRYVALVDVDEFLVVANNSNTGGGLLPLLDAEFAKPDVGGLQFRSRAGHADWPPNVELRSAKADRFNVSFLANFTVGPVERGGFRSKMIFMPERWFGVLKQSVHQPWAYQPGYREHIIELTKGIIYHLRKHRRASDAFYEPPTPFQHRLSALQQRVTKAITGIKDFASML